MQIIALKTKIVNTPYGSEGLKIVGQIYIRS